MKPLANYPLTLIIAAAIIVASLIPTRELPETDIELADKYAHTLMYFVMALTLWWEHSRKTTSAPSASFIILSVVLPASLGILLELAQTYLTTYRSGDYLDALANALGAIIALPIGLLLTYRRNRKKDNHITKQA